ncbi:hypothetical protein [Aquimarina sp. LLG6339-5]|uniref:hypothetical protein n=1 Tax=Aquimarina sp. LLG6339-5 TaxID=3160830 RepID=UPI00386B8AFF
MSELIENRNYNQNIKWEGDLNDDCTAIWCGLMLRAEWMDEDYWWWCVYDNMNNDIQIDSSNEYDERFIGGETARNKAEEIARNHLKDELISELKETSNPKIEKVISDLKTIGISPMQTIRTLIIDFGIGHRDAKNLLFNSPVWKGLREQSENLTQAFLDAGADNAENVEYDENGHINSITFDLTKEDSEKKQTLWNKLENKRSTTLYM